MTDHTTVLTDLEDDEVGYLNEDEGTAQEDAPVEGVERAVDTADEPDTEGEAFEEDEPRQDTAEEAIARRFGWKPKAEWKGDTTNHMEAGDYLERVINPRLEKVPKVEQLEAQLNEVRRQAMQLALKQQEATKQQQTTTLEQLRAERKRAFDLGDEKKFSEVEAKLEEYYAKREPELQGPPPEEIQRRVQAANEDPAFLEWLPSNQDWYGANEAATHLAAQIAAERLRAENVSDVMQLPSWARRAFYNEIAAEVRKRTGIAPAARQSAPKPPASEEGATARKAPVSAAKKSWNALPRDAREAYAQLSRNGIYTGDEKGKQEYARDYFKENPA